MPLHKVIVASQGTVPSTPETSELRSQFNVLLCSAISSGNFEGLKNAINTGLIKQVGVDPTALAGSPSPIEIDPIAPALAAATKLIFKPFGTASGRVYTDFAALMAVVAVVPGPKTIVFDNTGNPGGFFGTLWLPAGVWDFLNVKWQTDVNGPFSIGLPDGFKAVNLNDVSGCGLVNPCTIFSVSTEPIIDGTGIAFHPFLMNGGPPNALTIENDVGSAPFFKAAAPPFPGASTFIIITGGAQGLGGFYNAPSDSLVVPCIEIGAGATVQWTCNNGGALRAGALTGPASSTFVLNAHQKPFQATNFGLQPNFSGQTHKNALAAGTMYGQFDVLDKDSPSLVAGLGAITRINSSTGAFPVALPPAAQFPGDLIIADVGGALSGNNVTLNADGADTVIAGAAPAGSVVMDTNYSTLHLHSNGIDQWVAA